MGSNTCLCLWCSKKERETQQRQHDDRDKEVTLDDDVKYVVSRVPFASLSEQSKSFVALFYFYHNTVCSCCQDNGERLQDCQPESASSECRTNADTSTYANETTRRWRFIVCNCACYMQMSCFSWSSLFDVIQQMLLGKCSFRNTSQARHSDKVETEPGATEPFEWCGVQGRVGSERQREPRQCSGTR